MNGWKENKRTSFLMVFLGICIFAVVIFVICKFVLKIGNDQNGAVTASVNYERGYESLVELREGEFEKMSVKAFDELIMQHFEGKGYTFQEAMQAVSEKENNGDDNNRFITKTLMASLSELYQQKKTPYLPFSMTVKYTDFKDGTKDIKIAGNVYYEMSDPSKITVEKRDESLEKLAVKVENCANQMFLPELTKNSIRSEIESHFEEWQNGLATELAAEQITFRIALNSIEIQ